MCVVDAVSQSLGAGCLGDGQCAVVDRRQLGGDAAGPRVDRHGDADAFEAVTDAGEEFAVTGAEPLVFVDALEGVVLLGDDAALDGSAGPVHRDADLVNRDLLDQHALDVLWAEHLAAVGVGRHDHRQRGAAAPGHPRAVGVGDDTLLVVEDVFAEVPHGSVVVLGVPVGGDFVDATVLVGNELRHQRLNGVAIHLDHHRGRHQRRLDANRTSLIVADEDRRVQVADREQRVVDHRRLGEPGWLEVDSLAVGSEREQCRLCLLDRLAGRWCRRHRGGDREDRGGGDDRRQCRPLQSWSLDICFLPDRCKFQAGVSARQADRSLTRRDCRSGAVQAGDDRSTAQRTLIGQISRRLTSSLIAASSCLSDRRPGGSGPCAADADTSAR